jgi:CheY-like chemotaxis protein
MSRPKPGSLASRLDTDRVRTVLVVEDEPDIATFLGAFFRASGTELVHLDPADVAEVVERAVEVDASCVLIDLNLSGFSGFDVLEGFAADERVREVPRVVVTADARPSTQDRAAVLGATAFIPKPFNVKDLFRTVQSILDAQETAPLVSSDAVYLKLAAAITAARRTKADTSFALIRWSGTSSSPIIVDEVARRLEPAAVEILGATAADELAVLFARCSAERAAEQIAAALGDGPLDLELAPDRRVTVTVHVGVASSPAHGATGEELYTAADIALADAADAGRLVAIAQ